ncbi:MAG TPA: hypothetical protein VFB31_05125 [Pseudolabrys sp.]|nr:hypothetical protein [Pseudolabrys sp.]
MRFLVIGLAVACLALPVTKTLACEGYAAAAQATAVDLSAAGKKDDTAKPKKVAKKKKAPKVEYMRAAPMPPGAK